MKFGKITALLLSASLLASLAGCAEDGKSESGSSGSESKTASASSTVSRPEYDSQWTPAEGEVPALTNEYTDEAARRRAILNVGDTSRLAAAMKKAQSGEQITIATIGGSITQGTAATLGSQAYSVLFMEWWMTAFQTDNINYINAGIGATGSYIGVHRVETDVISQNPDVVIVEFSVNDTEAELNKITYDSLVRKLLSCDSKPAVILLFTTQENGTSMQSVHAEIGYEYNLPMISYKNVVLEEIKKGTYKWTDISPDNIHPNTMGHNIIAELLYAYLNSVLDDLDTISAEPFEFTAEPLTANLYENGKIFDSTSISPLSAEGFEKSSVSYQFPNDWTAEAGGTISFEVEARNIGIMYYRTTDGKSGKYEVLIDGVSVAALDGDFTGGWGDYAQADEVYTSDAAAKHTVEIRPDASSADKSFSVLGLLVS